MIGTREEAAPIDSRDAFALFDQKVELPFLAQSADFKAKTTECALLRNALNGVQFQAPDAHRTRGRVKNT
ncbi:hypothetical protein IAE57_03345 [Stenotrophomonas sp. S48]|uniref:hypothetical protein n=1 Tax=unclassified Stenotrophomonas TaxID=196198 RepID=UPI0019014FF0|nr:MULTISPECIES: hypothetical protein [unclassified Stenotrophomonas]MBK0025186.1 hypothetical protein [Stenotrophomonas sp. S48]MBK0046773.1 hypothetical protein [Stenotrophomonas sp. S49]